MIFHTYYVVGGGGLVQKCGKFHTFFLFFNKPFHKNNLMTAISFFLIFPIKSSNNCCLIDTRNVVLVSSLKFWLFFEDPFPPEHDQSRRICTQLFQDHWKVKSLSNQLSRIKRHRCRTWHWLRFKMLNSGRSISMFQYGSTFWGLRHFNVFIRKN